MRPRKGPHSVPMLNIKASLYHQKTDKYITVGDKRQKDHLSQAETLSAGQLLKPAEMKADDTSILVHIQDKDCVARG
ncbi:hypothetical protein DPEC_G00018680 [Dallia pectoralis]|uniref:Uncharacterized protein n=1 Tax=Dallia pectoralis TaxID=75939 RepID=A0ACC2HGW0_DALPE|nr:hypothetical protein DPEC_G00018680 [Dallia pectoralis]